MRHPAEHHLLARLRLSAAVTAVLGALAAVGGAAVWGLGVAAAVVACIPVLVLGVIVAVEVVTLGTDRRQDTSTTPTLLSPGVNP